MLSMALSVAVLASSGGLLSEHLPAGVRLLDAAEVIPSAMLGARRDRDRDDGISAMQLQSMSLQQLHEEYDRLEDEKPGIGLGIGLLAGGIGAIITGILMMALAYYSYVAIIGLTVMLAGIALAIVGPILLGRASRERRSISREQDAIDRQIRIMEGGGQGGAPLPSGPMPPPPPPPPPLSGLSTFEPHVVLASF